MMCFCFQNLLRFLWPLIRRFEILAGLFESALGIVVGLNGLAVFIDRALALAGHIEDLAQLHVAPDFGPAGLAVAVDGVAIGIGGGLEVALQEEDFRDAVVGQPAVLVGF